MKTFIIAICAVSIIIIGWFFLYQAIEDNADDLIHSLIELSKSIDDENWDLSRSQFEQVKNMWMDKREILTIFIDHHEIDNIDLAMARGRKYIDAKDKPLSLGEIEVLVQLFIIVKENEGLALNTVL